MNTKNYYITRYLAITCMFIEHLFFSLYKEGMLTAETYLIGKFIGRISFPLFAFEVSESYNYTKDKEGHLKKLIFLAFISDIPFGFMLQTFEYRNTCFTLLFGYASVYLKDKFLKEKKYFTALIAITLILAEAQILKTDYGLLGVLLVFLLALLKGQYLKPIIIFLFFIARSGSELVLWEYFGYKMFLPITCTMLIVCIVPKLKLTSGIRKWVVPTARYFYPVHLAVLGAIRYLI